MNRTLNAVLCFFLWSPLWCYMTGCSANHWLGTEDVQDSFTVKKGLGGASLSMKSRKDVKATLDIDKGTINPDTGNVDLNGVHVTYDGRATEVITADAQRSLAVGQAQLSQAAYLDAAGRLIANVGDAVKSGLLGAGEAKAMILNAGLSPLQGASGSFGPQGGSFQLGGTKEPTPPTTPTTQKADAEDIEADEGVGIMAP